jgi:protein arginine kinase activator
MICEHCKQRHASVTITQVQNGTKLERHYCEVCASQFHPFHFDAQEEPISLHQLMSNWFGMPTKKTQAEPKKALNCPSCGFTYRQFLKVGKFGCPTCYDTFRSQLPSVLQRIQADVQHVGYKQQNDQSLKIQDQIDTLRQQMHIAISEENFEKAAQLRDQIRSLEAKLQAGGVNES